MAITSGDFSASGLSAAMVKADRMWADSMLKPDYEANVDVVKAIQSEQNADVSILEDPDKDRDVKVTWVGLCNETAEDCTTDDCDIAGNELGSDSKTYSLTECKGHGFTVDEYKLRTNDYNMEDIVAKGMMLSDKVISEAIAGIAAARIESLKGTNLAPDAGTWNAVTSETDIAAANWDETLFAYFYRAAIQNKMSNPWLLSGSNLFDESFLANLSKANGEGKGAYNLYNSMRKYFDLFNIDAANTPDLKTYMINRGAMAFASKNYFGETPIKYMDDHRFSVPSRNIPGLRLDVIYKNRCSANTVKHDFYLKAKFDFFGNPTGCDATQTGVLAFNKTS